MYKLSKLGQMVRVGMVRLKDVPGFVRIHARGMTGARSYCRGVEILGFPCQQLERSIVFNALKMLDGAIDLSLGKLNMPACFV